ncbi:hypothetical protein C7S16_3226 [Burkholderia thailandensis]|uniref:Uncharacterized protein n=1 Tax=Burkholderia thailandensis TaxID=57975 RepID=A0AAW9CXL2_BURTH|nr:hypothetical protein [Burkholderia thailandensis]
MRQPRRARAAKASQRGASPFSGRAGLHGRAASRFSGFVGTSNFRRPPPTSPQALLHAAAARRRSTHRTHRSLADSRIALSAALSQPRLIGHRIRPGAPARRSPPHIGASLHENSFNPGSAAPLSRLLVTARRVTSAARRFRNPR